MKQKQATIWIRQSLLVLLQTVFINLRIKVHTLAWNYVSNKESNDLRKSLNYTCIQSPLTASVQERGNGEEENRQFISSPLSNTNISALQVHATRYLSDRSVAIHGHSLHTTQFLQRLAWLLQLQC